MTERLDGGETRYRMLETLRQFGLEVLSASGRADAARALHFDYFLGWVRGMEDALRRPYADEVQDLQRDVDNLRAALTWGFQAAPERAADLTTRLVPLWNVAGYYGEGRRWYQRILDLGDAPDPAERAHVLGRMGRLAFVQGDYEASLRCEEERAGIYESLGDEMRYARALTLTGTLHGYLGDPERSLAIHAQARPIYERLGDPSLLARFESSVGLASFLNGDYADARHRFELSRVQSERDGDTNRVQIQLGNLAIVDVLEGRGADARSRLRDSLALCLPLRNLYGIFQNLPALAEALRLEGDPAAAARVLGACDALQDQIEARLEAMERLVHDRVMPATREALGDEAFEAARQAGRALTWEDVVALA